MCQIGMIAQDSQLNRSLRHALQASAGCQVSSFDNALDCPPVQLHHFNLLIVEWRAIALRQQFFQEFSRINPAATVVLIAPHEVAAGLADHAALGIDEIISPPHNEHQMTAVCTRLFQKSAAVHQLCALQERLHREMRQRQIVARSRAMREIICRLPQLGDAGATILLTGETGTGKELIARAIHYLGPRAGQSFVTVDCGALPEHLSENELFGHGRGAYTGANASAIGLIQEAAGGTLFLDEIEALPLSVQAKFLRFLQEHQYRPLGQTKYITVDVQVIAASNRDLAEAVRQREFRQDLYYRLEGVKIIVPPLRERKADIPALAFHFLEKYSSPATEPAPTIPEHVLCDWLNYDWPGNVRELENKIRSLLLAQQPGWETGAPFAGSDPEAVQPLMEVRREALAQCDITYLQKLMKLTEGNLSAAARLAKIHRKNLAHLLKKYGIVSPRHRYSPVS
ncbi:MAG: sigma-54 dependent transcriptional regulator [candidate division KSB1 bacterium]|nr:sigma-54 dependent transcriptional regulator [candidate division KSB1 bacterium]MDZ7273999.1 sigma-54 dependent transcriptional regulator [candidate division KSB1 bacterium]MDZ7286372.1 sigma-54 dependent transcriptional regulator [candidate division KSB1 bacterium]MDZ7296600.1 sigma-54 dependent transcriptional regulator [candidate division KSB1 bacterium]MDZ7309067.1 sigma-54 dependent transcriptional regulator [candidate division KSB1 bacterium]